MSSVPVLGEIERVRALRRHGIGWRGGVHGDAVPALACFNSTATWSLIVKHDRRRAAPDPAIEEMAALPHLLERARGWIG
jgi:hypothetical protein